MRIAVVILNWNTEDFLRKFLPGLIDSVSRVEGAGVVVADNASTDGSVGMVRELFPDVEMLVFERNLGFTGGYNEAFRILSQSHPEMEYFLLINSDIEVGQTWLEPLVEWMDAHPDCGASAPKLHSWQQRDMFEYAGAAGGFIDRFGYPFCRGRLFDSVETDEGQYDDIADIHWATGACMVLRTKVFKECGGFDERFFAHNEEIDLCWRMRLYGYRICVVPQSVVYHLGGGTLPQGNPRKVYLNFRNNLTMLFKNLPDSELGKVMAMRFFLDRLAVFQCLCKRDLKGAKAILTARKDFAKWKSEYIPVRKEIQSKAISSERMTMSFSVLFKYFFFGKKKYSQLRG